MTDSESGLLVADPIEDSQDEEMENIIGTRIQEISHLLSAAIALAATRDDYAQSQILTSIKRCLEETNSDHGRAILEILQGRAILEILQEFGVELRNELRDYIRQPMTPLPTSVQLLNVLREQARQPMTPPPQPSDMRPLRAPGAPVRRQLMVAKRCSLEAPCAIAHVRDVPAIKSAEMWSRVQGQMNVITHTPTVPCDLLSLSRHRLAADVLEVSVWEMASQMATLYEKSACLGGIGKIKEQLSHFPIEELERTDPIADSCLVSHDTLDSSLALLGFSSWPTVKQNWANGIPQARSKRIRDLIAAYEAAKDDIDELMSQAQCLRYQEDMLSGVMYPQNSSDICQLMNMYDILPSRFNAKNHAQILTVPSLGDEHVETCVICQDRDLEQIYVKISPRCSSHAHCIETRRSGGACTCKNKFFHLGCLSQNILQEYRGTNASPTDFEGTVGRCSLRCPACMLNYCIRDLTAIRIAPAQPTPTKAGVTMAAAKETRQSRTTKKRTACESWAATPAKDLRSNHAEQADREE